MKQRLKIVASIKKGNQKKKYSKFYGIYSVVIFRCLRKPIFLKFLNWVMKIEKIQKEKVKNIQIRMFPSIKNNGNPLIGKCNTQGEIFLYPKRLDMCRKKIKKIKPESFKKYIEGRARASLIHEILHLKYESDENKVRKLTKKYFSIFHQNQHSDRSELTKYKKMIFNY